MHFRVSKVRRSGKTYMYAQLVQSYRRDTDGMPAHRVVANLGRVDEVEAENLRVAFAASRRGERVAVAPEQRPKPGAAPKRAANLAYLDVAVLLELWSQWRLDELLRPLMPPGDASLEPTVAICALTLQRCVAPESKLFATRWFPRTALPELLGVAPASFNNTRLHRVLDALDDAGPALMRKLPRLYAERDGAFVSMFLDVSDACFVGQGPELAELAKAKTGGIRRKIGIVLLCNEHGYPLRWEVVKGARSDGSTMGDMFRSIRGLSWLGQAPVVCDRAMGRTAHVRELLDTGVRFLTALTTPEFDAYSQKIPHAAFADLDIGADEDSPASAVMRASRLAEASGMARVDDDLFVLDLDVVERDDDDESSEPSQLDAPYDGADEDPTVHAMRLTRRIIESVADGRYSSYAAAGRALGVGRGLNSKYRQLAALPEAIQLDVLGGAAEGRSLAALIDIARLEDPEQQRLAFDALVQAPAPKHAPRKPAPPSPARAEASASPVRVRAVAYFNPQRFVDARLAAAARLAKIEAFVEDLNRRLAAPRSRMTRDGIVAAVDRELRPHGLVEAFELNIEPDSSGGRERYRLSLSLVPAQWRRRRRYDGFSLLVAHPDVEHTAAELCRLYRAKDAVEKDFGIIKGMLAIHPVRHRVDSKVRAHVTLCMLALLLERTLRRKLAGTCTAAAALERLAPCHLNLYAEEGSLPAYTITRTDSEQDAILRALRLQHLADDQELADRIHPR